MATYAPLDLNKSKPIPQPVTLSPPPEPEGGYDDEMFLTPPPKDLQCIVCLLTVRDPQLITCCGALVCKICMLRSNASSVCPKCRHGNPNIVQNKQAKGLTMDLKVKCTKGDNCNWTGELVDYSNHIEEKCPCRTIECQYGCGQCFMAVDIPVHTKDECTKRPIDVRMESGHRILLETIEMKHSSLKSDLEALVTRTENENIRKLEKEKAVLEQEKEAMKKKTWSGFFFKGIIVLGTVGGLAAFVYVSYKYFNLHKQLDILRNQLIVTQRTLEKVRKDENLLLQILCNHGAKNLAQEYKTQSILKDMSFWSGSLHNNDLNGYTKIF